MVCDGSMTWLRQIRWQTLQIGKVGWETLSRLTWCCRLRFQLANMLGCFTRCTLDGMRPKPTRTLLDENLIAQLSCPVRLIWQPVTLVIFG